MPNIKPDSSPRKDVYQTFCLLCETRALRFREGDLALGEAVDFLQHWAVKHELVRALGQDAVQMIMAWAFEDVRCQ